MMLRFRRPLSATVLLFVLVVPLLLTRAADLDFADFNGQGLFNNFSGDSGAFASEQARISGTFDSTVFHGTNGASLRIDYAVPSGFCGIWNSLLGKASYSKYTLNFTNLHGSLRNGVGCPVPVENVHVTNFSFWARGDGKGEFDHAIKVEFKNPQTLIGSALFLVPNQTNWTRLDFPISTLTNDVSQLKEIVFVIEDWRNSNRVSSVYLDDLTFTSDEPTCDPATLEDNVMLDLVSQRAFSYFLRFTDDLGFALDRSTFSDMVSVGTIGFQLTAYCVGHQRGWADRAELEQRVLGILRNLNEIPTGPEPGTSRGGYRGFYYHFLAANTGLRKDDNVELSLYDTMLLMFGALTCKEYFTNNTQIQALSQQLFDRVEWDWFVDHSSGPNRNQFYLAWKPGPKAEGTFQKHVDGQTDEALMVDVLALGSRTHPVSPETYFARSRVFGRYLPTDSDPIMVSWRGSLFNYFFASCWLNFESRGFDLHPAHSDDIWQNDQRAIVANRQFCIDHASPQAGRADGQYVTYGDKSWGLTACDNLVQPGPGMGNEYFSFGALPSEENIRFGTKALHAGTIAVYGAGSSLAFTPNESIAAIRHFFEIPNLWSSLFGFGDAFSLDPHYLGSPYDPHGNPSVRYADYLNGPWVNSMTMGINLGPMLLAIENYRSHQIWNLTTKSPEITAGLDRIFGIGSPEATVSTDEVNGRNRVMIQWKPEPGASEYSVFGSPDSENWSLVQDGIRETTWTNSNAGKKIQWAYRVKAIR